MTRHPLTRPDGHAPFVKVCGQTHQLTTDCATAYGAKMLGFIFHPGSVRSIAPERVAKIQTTGTRRVGVFVHQGAAEIMRIMDIARLDFAQLHGKQNMECATAIGPKRVIRVLWPERYENIQALQDDIDAWAPHCALYLLDSGRASGGHGRELNASALDELEFPHPWILAGGLSGENLPRLLKQCHPSGVDINSGIENAPGLKSTIKLLSVFKQIG